MSIWIPRLLHPDDRERAGAAGRPEPGGRLAELPPRGRTLPDRGRSDPDPGRGRTLPPGGPGCRPAAVPADRGTGGAGGSDQAPRAEPGHGWRRGGLLAHHGRPAGVRRAGGPVRRAAGRRRRVRPGGGHRGPDRAEVADEVLARVTGWSVSRPTAGPRVGRMARIPPRSWFGPSGGRRNQLSGREQLAQPQRPGVHRRRFNPAFLRGPDRPRAPDPARQAKVHVGPLDTECAPIRSPVEVRNSTRSGRSRTNDCSPELSHLWRCKEAGISPMIIVSKPPLPLA